MGAGGAEAPTDNSTATVQSVPGDFWLTNIATHPALTDGNVVAVLDPDLFAGLHAEVLGGRLRISWQPAAAGASAQSRQIVIHASAAEPTQWPVRDWHSYPMKRSGNIEQADVPTEDLDVPILYYARVVTPNGDRVSPLRSLHPRRLGLEEPTQLFWPFVEGFEDGYEGWRLLPGSENEAALRISSEGKNGRAALQISLNPTASAASMPARLATTRIRGWQLLQEGAIGIRFWIRTRSGRGAVHCTLQARSSTTNQVSGAWAKQIPVENQWEKVDLLFAQLPILPWRSVDQFILEFRAPSPVEFLLDDIQLLGPWKLHPE